MGGPKEADMKSVKQILERLRDDVDWDHNDDLLQESLLDSLDIIQLVSELDENFSISIEATDLTPENFRNIQTISALVERHQIKKRPIE